MTEREKVIKGLGGVYRCISPVNHTCGDCPYQDNHVECARRVLRDAIVLLKEQEERIKELESMTVSASGNGVAIDAVRGGLVIQKQTAKEIHNVKHVDCYEPITSQNERIAKMYREKVIKGITHHKLGMCDMSGKICPYWNEDDGCSKKMLEDAITLLKEQEPKKVEWLIGRAHCPSCGELFPRKKETQYIRFCSFCGQEVKWE